MHVVVDDVENMGSSDDKRVCDDKLSFALLGDGNHRGLFDVLGSMRRSHKVEPEYSMRVNRLSESCNSEYCDDSRVEQVIAALRSIRDDGTDVAAEDIDAALALLSSWFWGM